MRVLPHKSPELIDLGVLRHRLSRRQHSAQNEAQVRPFSRAPRDRATHNPARVEERLEPAVRPRGRRLVEGLLVHERGAVRGLCELVAGAGRGGAQLARRVVAHRAGALAAYEGAELIELGALGDCIPLSVHSSWVGSGCKGWEVEKAARRVREGMTYR